MPISAEYVVSYLLQETRAERLLWDRISGQEFDGYAAQLNGVALRFTRIDSSTESRLWLKVESEEGCTFVAEPRGFGLWGRRYRTAEEETLARLLTELEKSVSGRSSRQAAEETDPTLRQQLFRRILFADPAVK